MPNIFKNDVVTEIILEHSIILYDGMPAACILKSYADNKFSNFTKLNGIGHEKHVNSLYQKFKEYEPSTELIRCNKMPLHLSDLNCIEYFGLHYIKIVLHRENHNDIIIKILTYNSDTDLNKLFEEISNTIIFEYGLLAMRKVKKDDNIVFQKNLNRDLIMYKDIYYSKLNAMIFSLSNNIETIISNLLDHVAIVREIHHIPVPRHEHLIYALTMLKFDVKFHISEIDICYSIENTNNECLLCQKIICNPKNCLEIVDINNINKFCSMVDLHTRCRINNCHSICFIKDIKLKQKKGIYQSLNSIDYTIKKHLNL